MLEFNLLKTVPVCVRHREQAGSDPYGAPVWHEVHEVVDGCLVEPGATGDLGAERPQGVSRGVTVHFPKTYAADLKGALVDFGGRTYRVVGSPAPYMPANCPGPWNRSAECEACDG